MQDRIAYLEHQRSQKSVAHEQQSDLHEPSQQTAAVASFGKWIDAGAGPEGIPLSS